MTTAHQLSPATLSTVFSLRRVLAGDRRPSFHTAETELDEHVVDQSSRVVHPPANSATNIETTLKRSVENLPKSYVYQHIYIPEHYIPELSSNNCLIHVNACDFIHVLMH